MSWRGTLLLAIIAGLALGFFLFSGRTRTHPPQEPLLGIDPAVTGSIQIQERGGSFSLLKKNGLWMLQGTVSDRADPRLVRSLLNTAADITPLDVLRPRDLKEPVSLTSLNLKKPNRSITIRDGSTHAIWLGVEGPSRDELYARLDPGNAVYLISGKIAALAFRPIGEYRDPILTELAPDHLSEVSVTRGASLQELRLKKDAHGWTLTSPLTAQGDDQAVADWLKGLLASGIIRWMPEGTDPSECGLDAPTAVITLLSGGEATPLTLTVGSPVPDAPGSYYLRCSDRPGICIVKGIDAILSLTPLSLRSKKIRQVEYDTVDRIEIGAGSTSLTLLRKAASDDWFVAGNSSITLPGSRVRAWFDQLQSLQAINFEAATPDHLKERGLDLNAPGLRIRLVAKLSENTAQENEGEVVLAEYNAGTSSNNEVALREGTGTDLMILPAPSFDPIRNEAASWNVSHTSSPTPSPEPSVVPLHTPIPQ